MFEDNIKNIKKLITVLTGKDCEVFITYKGTTYGVVKPWNIKCDTREVNSETYESAASELLELLKAELSGRIMFAEKQANSYRDVLNSVSKEETATKKTPGLLLQLISEKN